MSYHFPTVGSVSNTPATVTPSGSPYTYANTSGRPQAVSVSIGTVSAIDFAHDGAAWISLGVIAGQFLIPNGASLRVTYAVAPTMRAVTL